MSWKNSVCITGPTPSVGDINIFVKSTMPTTDNAIDTFYKSTLEILTLQPSFFTSYGPGVTSSIFISLISATENYFRDILGFSLSICVISQAHAADEKVQLGSLLWAGNHLHNRSAFEFMAFSSADNITKTLNKFVDFSVPRESSWGKMLKEYDKLCELRHAIVHSGNIVAGKNAIKLSLSKSIGTAYVNVDYTTLQSAGAVCTRLVQAANNDLFELMVSRWAETWRAHASWDASTERALFDTVKTYFTSERDRAMNTIVNKMADSDIYNAVCSDYNLC